MGLAMSRVYTLNAIRQIEQKIIAQGTNAAALMQWAGEAAWQSFKQFWPEAKTITVLCGGGNNAGDGYVLARCAQAEGKKVNIFYLKNPNDLPEPAKQMAKQAIMQGVIGEPWTDGVKFSADVLVDALLGIGFGGDLSEPYQQIILQANQSHLPIFAIDVPSGLNAANGEVKTVAITANQTITMLGLKPGLLTNDAFDYVGNLLVAVWPKQDEVQACGEIMTANIVADCLLPRKQNCNKGDFGHVLAIGGAPGFSGAIQLAAESALRVGAGLVSVATHPAHAAFINVGCPELMCHAINSAEELAPLFERASVILLGSGLGQNDWGKALWQVAVQVKKPMVLDADGLNLLAQNPLQREDWILTPHPGEAARLLHTETTAIQADRWRAVEEIQKQYQAITVLKGAGTLIANENNIFVNAASNPGMATAGMGDVLVGMIAGFLAQGLSFIDAAKVGVLIHSLAAEKIAQEQGPRGMLASDLWQALPEYLNL